MAAPGPRWTIRAKLTLIFMVTLLFFSLISAVAFSGILSLSLQQQLRFSLLQTEAQAQKKVQKDLAILASILERQRERVHSSLEALLAQIPPGEFAAQIVAGELARRARVRRLQQVQQYLRLSLLTVTDLEGRVLIRATNPQRYGDSVLAAAPTLEPLWERARQGQATAALGCLPAEVLRFERVLPFTALPGVTRPGDSLVKQVRSPARPRRNAVAKPSLTEVLMYFSVLPVRDERGKAVAVVWAGEVLNHTQHLVDRYHSVVLNSHAAVYLGPLCIATSRTLPNGRRAVGTVMPPPVVQAVLENGQNWQGDLLLPWGEELLTAYQPLRDGQGKIIGALAVGTPRSFFAPVLRALEQSTRLLAARTHHLWATEVVLSLLLALLVAWLVAARLSAPIRKLRAGAQRIGEGDFDYRLRIRT
ncbi:MAG TPA: HAMP domain-containing protein, partial [Armatimonadetes bacterium]|nr:HAMP domain-containing protein [Armatimonadota bacterium]